MSCILTFAAATEDADHAALQEQGLLPLAQTGYWAAPAVLANEAAFFQAVQDLQHRPSPLDFPEDWLVQKKTEILSRKKRQIDHTEQLDDVFGLLTRRHRLSVITGAPGTAKTTITSLWMQIALSKYSAMPVILLAQEKTALNRLYDRINFEGSCAWTIDEALQRPWPREAAIIVDEAGLLCTETLAAILARAEKTDAVKIILIGDDRQLIPDAPGQPFRWLCQQESVDRITLEISFRQKNPILRKAVAALYRGRITTALKKLSCHFLQPEDLIPGIRKALENTSPDKTLILLHGPNFIAENLALLCPGFRVLSLAAAQGLAIDRVVFIIAEPIHLGEMLVGCSRQRFALDIFVDTGVYSDETQLGTTIEPYPQSLMALDVVTGETLLQILDQA